MASCSLLCCFHGLLLLLFSWPPPAAAAQASPPSLHILSSPAFFSSNYHHMLQRFKIYIYPTQPTHSTFDFRSPLLHNPVAPPSVEHLFFRSLSDSHFVTDVADEADLFFLPVSVTAMARSLNVSVTRNLMMYVQQLREQYPYWQRTLGADHVLVSCRGIKRDFSRNVLELQKNAILVACDNMLAAGSNGEFYPHKDLAMPSYFPTAVDFSIAGFASEERPYLLFMLNSRDSIEGKFAAYDHWTEDTAFVGDSENFDIPSYYKMLSLSRFCVTFGHTASNTSIVDGMRLGCVPVIIANGYLFNLPFQDILDWQQFSLIVSLNQLSKLKSFLAEVPEDKYRALQKEAIAASKHFEWHSSPRPYDAFHMLMYELWLRRHTVRYPRRSSQ